MIARVSLQEIAVLLMVPTVAVALQPVALAVSPLVKLAVVLPPPPGVVVAEAVDLAPVVE